MIKDKKIRRVLSILLLVYIAGLVYCLILSPQFRSYDLPEGYKALNLVPFAEMKCFIYGVGELGIISVLQNLIGNVVGFMPLGILLPCVFKRLSKAYACILTGAAVSVFAEILQYILKVGVCDIDDVILNTIGVCIGYVVYKLIIGSVRRE